MYLIELLLQQQYHNVLTILMVYVEEINSPDF